MFVTEVEAKKMTCPVGMANQTVPVTGYCVASKCMAWRWGNKEYKKIKDEPCPDCPDIIGPKYCDRCMEEETYGRKQEFEIINRGYCVLARRPSNQM